MATTTQGGGLAVKKKSRSSERDRLASPLGMAVLYAVLIGGALLTIFPFYYTLVTATHRTSAILTIPPPLWFGNEHAPDDENPIYGTAKVVIALRELEQRGFPAAIPLRAPAEAFLISRQLNDGAWSGAQGGPEAITFHRASDRCRA